MKDYKIVDGKIQGNAARQDMFQHGQRFVTCRSCSVLRPGAEMMMHPNDGPVCKDVNLCYRLKNEATN